MFTELMNNIWDEFARYVFNVEVEVQGEQAQRPRGPVWGAAANASSTGRYDYAGGTAADQPSALAAAAQTAGVVPAPMAEAVEYAVDATAEPPPHIETRRLEEHEKIGRNDPQAARQRLQVQEAPWRRRRPPRAADAARGLFDPATNGAWRRSSRSCRPLASGTIRSGLPRSQPSIAC